MPNNSIKITAARKQVIIDIDDLLYVVVQDRKSKLCFEKREPILTNLSIRKLYEMLPEGRFVLINKGVLISLQHLVQIDQLNYRMSDGTVLRARVKTSSQHNWQMRMRVLENQYNIQQQLYDMMQNTDIAFALLQMTQRERIPARTVYCNRAWERVVSVLRQEKSGEAALHAYEAMQEVAWQGGVRMLRGKHFRACFFRADQGICACLLQNVDMQVQS